MKSFELSGYTIVEVLLFIGISSAMFILAITSFSGRQAQVQFSQSVREFDAKLQDTINDISAGYYSSDGLLNCELTADPASRPVIDDIATPVQAGSNQNCVFIGKAIQFSPEDGDSATENENLLYIYNIIGKRYDQVTGKDAVTLDQAKPVAMSPRLLGEFADKTEKTNLQYGLRVTRVVVNTPIPTDVGVIGFFTSFAKLAPSSTTQQISGGVAVKSAYITNTNLGQTQYEAVAEINSITDANVDTSSNTEIIICLADPDLNRRASITIGGDGRATTRIDFDTYNVSVCVP